ncbi:MAG: LysM domain-containing protein [Verrucomicrobiota bacterium JB023]|nr:LysM domain-containing protein [Verrucomicrobiota bacterium JB023]
MKNLFPSLLCYALLGLLPCAAEGIHDLVKPNLDELRQAAEEERRREEAAREKARQEAEAKRLEEEARQREIAAAKADPMVDVEDLKLGQESGGGQQEYVVQAGDTLGGIAAERYGNSWYYPVIEFWNDCNATKVYVGQKIKTPSIATIAKVKGTAVLSRYPDEMTAMLQLRKDYLALETQLRSEIAEGEVSEASLATLKELRATAKKIHGGFLVKRPGVKEYATSLLAQCKNLVDQFDAMLQGDYGRRNSRLTRVHTHLGQAMRNAFVWGVEDFN